MSFAAWCDKREQWVAKEVTKTSKCKCHECLKTKQEMAGNLKEFIGEKKNVTRTQKETQPGA